MTRGATRAGSIWRRSSFRAGVSLPVAICLAACGSSGGDPGPVASGPATASTLAYVLSECSADPHGGSMRQTLEVRRNDAPPIVIADHATAGSGDGFAACPAAGLARNSSSYVSFGVFHRLGVSPDGSRVVFEVTDAKAPTLFPLNGLPEEETGFFSVRSDGSELHRLGPASRVSPAALGYTLPFLAFSPGGDEVAYVDLGLGSDGSESPQIYVLDLGSGESTQITRLPRGPSSSEDVAVCCPLFNDERTISFFTRADADGMHADGKRINVTVRTDGTGLTVSPPLEALPGSEILDTFRITGSASVALIGLPETAVNGGMVKEVVTIDRDDHILQLTDFHRNDTYTPTLSASGERVFFSGSADRLGTNPTENCQVFSVSRLGGDLRQLTDFSEGPHARGCASVVPPLGCFVFVLNRDTLTNDLVFLSSCDPFGTNPFGFQVFAIHEDGSGLNQLTDGRGFSATGGTTTTEYAFPFAHPGQHDYFH